MIEGRPPHRVQRRWRPFLRFCHAWVGLILSVFLAAMAASGSILLFKDELRLISVGSAAVTPTQDTSVLGRVANAAKRNFGGDLRSIRFAHADFPAHEAVLEDGGAYLDNQGKIVREWEGVRPLDLLVEFHHRLFMAETGRNLLGVLAVFLTVMLVSGFTLWWPLRRAWRLSLWPGANRRSAILAVHRDLGALLMPVLMIISLTGVVISWPSLVQPLFDFSRKPGVIDVGPTEAVDWRVPLRASLTAAPDAAIRQLSFGLDGKPSTLRLRHSEDWNPQGLTFVWITGAGKIAKVVDTRAESRSARTYGMIFPLHSGQTPMQFFRYLLLIAGVGLLLISILGAQAFCRRLMRSAA